jgi:hypothetical protein
VEEMKKAKKHLNMLSTYGRTILMVIQESGMRKPTQSWDSIPLWQRTLLVSAVISRMNMVEGIVL